VTVKEGCARYFCASCHCRLSNITQLLTESGCTAQGFDSTKIVKEGYSRYNLSLGVGLTEVAGKVFRIGHLGNNDEIMVGSYLFGAEMAMISAGLDIKPGSGVGKAIEYWASTSSVIPTRG